MPALLVFLIVAVLARGWLVRPLVMVMAPDPVDHEVKFSAAGFSVYRETILFAPLSGEITPLVSDGELVSRNTPVVRLDNPDAAAAYRQRLEQVQDQVNAWVAEHADVLRTASAEAADAREAFSASVLDVKVEGSLDTLREDMLRFEDAHRAAVSLLAEWSARSERLEELRTLADGAQDRILSPRAGVVRLRVDGLEKVLGWDEPLDPPLTEALLDWDGQAHEVSLSVTAGSPVVRVLDHMELDAILLVEREGASLLHSGSTLRLNVDGIEQLVEGSVKDIGSPLGDIIAVRVDLDHRLPFFFERRAWEGTVTVDQVPAHAVPASALICREGECGVYGWVQQRPVWMPVEVLDRPGKVAVVTGLSRGDSVVSNPGLIEWFRLR